MALECVHDARVYGKEARATTTRYSRHRSRGGTPVATPMKIVPEARRPVDREALLRELRNEVGDVNVLSEPEALAPFGKDETHGMEPFLPDAVVHASSSDEVSRVLQVCSRLGVPV